MALGILTGLFGVLMVTPLMNAMGLQDFAARGVAAGLAAHGIATAILSPLLPALSGWGPLRPVPPHDRAAP